MRITWFSWKDIDHPETGGAEVVSDQLRQRLVRDGHTVTLITAQYPGSLPTERVKGVDVIRVGGRFSVYRKARGAYRRMGDPQDLVIDEMNTVPFMASLYRKEANSILLTYQLARSVWFYQMPFPVSYIGYWLEPLYLRFISKYYPLVLTESESTKTDLLKYGFKKSAVKVFRVGMETKRPKTLPSKPAGSNLIFLGALRPMKQPIDAIQAFEAARDKRPDLTLTMAGNNSGDYAKKVIDYAQKSRHAKAIDIQGRVSDQQKSELLSRAQLILVTSIKEGWGLIVTEANSQGTPAVVYNTDGLRDSVVADQTGRIVPSRDTKAMAKAVLGLLDDKTAYTQLRQQAFEHSKQFTFDNSYADFMAAINSFAIMDQ